MTASRVVDASLAFRTIVPNPAQAALRQLFAEWRKQASVLLAPTLWLYEVIGDREGVPAVIQCSVEGHTWTACC